VVAHPPVGSKYTKYIDVRLMFLKELCRDRKVFDIVFARSLHRLTRVGAPSRRCPEQAHQHQHEAVR
jgi:hypothetical protein